MLERLSTCLFHPRMIGKYISDKFGRILLYFIILITVLSIPTFITVYFPATLSTKEANYIVEDIKKHNFTPEVEYKNNKLIGNPSYSITMSSYIFNFGDLAVVASISNVVFDFKEDSLSIIMGGINISSTPYSEFKVSNFKFAEIAEGNVLAKDSFLFFIESAYQEYNTFQLPFNFVITFATVAFMIIMMSLIMYMFTSFINPLIPGKYRLKICFYSTTVYAVCELIGLLFGMGFLTFIGIVLSYIYTHMSLKAIVKIEVKKPLNR